MLYIVVAIGFSLMILERLIPDQKLPQVKGWWTRVIINNAFQLGIIYLGSISWDIWFHQYRIFDLENTLNPLTGGFLAYIIITFIFYWWHFFRHKVNVLWNVFHQVHHSPRRIETITSFYKHPFEILVNSLLIGFLNYVFLGIGTTAAAWTLLFTSLAEYFYHMNIATPRWVGYFIQRPEMHRLHHELGKHTRNFADLPVWDMLFGTYENPGTSTNRCGFKPEREQRFLDMLLFKNVNNPIRPKK